jgi:predicted metallo-beta-lactamase superfamily hydrolase
MADFNHLSEAEAIRELAQHTEAVIEISGICYFLQYQYHHRQPFMDETYIT